MGAQSPMTVRLEPALGRSLTEEAKVRLPRRPPCRPWTSNTQLLLRGTSRPPAPTLESHFSEADEISLRESSPSMVEVCS